MKTYKKRNIAQRLSQAQDILVLAQSDPVISATLADYGFTEARFAEGTRRLEAASSRETDQRAQLGAQVSATRTFTNQFSSLQIKFRTDRRVAQTVLENNPKLYEGLRLHLPTDQSRDGFIRQAIHFYQEITVHKEVMAALQKEFNLTESIFIARLQELKTLMKARQTQLLMKGSSRVATQQRRAAMKALDDYMDQLIGVARVAFKNNERQLRKLGVMARIRE